jgi:hypothetical protein
VIRPDQPLGRIIQQRDFFRARPTQTTTRRSGNRPATILSPFATDAAKKSGILGEGLIWRGSTEQPAAPKT